MIRTRTRTRTRLRSAGAIAVLALALAPAAAHAAGQSPTGTTLLLGRPDGLGTLPSDAGNYSSQTTEALSANGRYLVFTSAADAIDPTDDDSVVNVFVRDLQTSTTTLVSRASGAAGAPANDDSVAAVISADGTRVAFTSYATNLGATGGQVYVRDLVAKTTTIVSCVSATACTPGGGSNPSINGDGTKVAFESTSSALAPDTNNSTTDIFVRDLTTSSTILVSRKTGAGGLQAAQPSMNPSISDDGNRVAWETIAQLSPSDTNPNLDIYVRDISGSLTRWVSHGGSFNSGDASIAGNGSAIAFRTVSPLDAVHDANGVNDVYLWSYSLDNFALMSRATGALTNAGNAGSYEPSVDTTGATVAFTSAATNLGDGDVTGTEDVHVRNGSTTTLVSRASGAGGAQGNADSGTPATDDGAAHVAFTSQATSLVPSAGSTAALRSYVRTTGTQATAVASVPTGPATVAADAFVDNDQIALSSGYGGQSSGSGLSDDGRYLAFTSGSDGLLTGDDDSVSNVYLRDILTDRLTLVSRSTAGQAANGPSYQASISADGTHVAFESYSTNLDGAPGGPGGSVYVRDLTTGTTTLASRADGPNGAPASFANGTALDADGTRVAFLTADALDAKDTNGTTDVYVRDLEHATTTLASRADGASSNGSNSYSVGAAINADGTRVAFVTGGTNLGDGDVDGTANVHLRDLTANTTTLVDRADGAAGAIGGDNAYAVAIDGAGNRVAFESYATNLGGSPPAQSEQVYVRDVAAKTTTLVSRASGAAGAAADDYASQPRISSDGRHVAFVARATNLLPPSSASVAGVFVRDLDTQVTELASVADGAGGAPAALADEPAISADGGCVAFVSASRLTTPGYASPDYLHAYLRVLSGSCPRVASDTTGGGGSGSGGGTTTTAPATTVPVAKPAAPAKDTTKPTIAGLALKPARFAVAAGATALTAAAKKKTPKGTTIAFTLSEKAATTLTITRSLPGRRKGRGCVAPGKAPKHAKACTRTEVVGTLKRAAAVGKRSVPFTGRLGRRALAPGSYVLTVVATDAAGNRSAPRAAKFTVVKR